MVFEEGNRPELMYSWNIIVEGSGRPRSEQWQEEAVYQGHSLLLGGFQL